MMVQVYTLQATGIIYVIIVKLKVILFIMELGLGMELLNLIRIVLMVFILMIALIMLNFK